MYNTTLNEKVSIHCHVTCSHCWEKFPTENIRWISQHPKLLGDTRLGEDFQKRFLPSHFTPQGQAFDAEGMVCEELACPKCHLPIPRVLLEQTPFFMSIVGAPSCGKSYFLTSMVWMLRQSLPRRCSLAFNDADTISNQIINHYEELQFYNEDRDAIIRLAKTEEQGDLYDSVQYDNQIVSYPRPFLFSIAPSINHPNSKYMQRVARVLCLYDNAGESFLPGKDSISNPVTRHLARSEALLYLFDPTQDPRFRKAYQGEKASGGSQSSVTSRQEILLHELVARVRKHASLHHNEKHDKPLIVVVTKYDIWNHLLNEPVFNGPWLSSESPHLAILDVQTIRHISDKLRDLLWKLSPELVASVESFTENAWFIPVSATGRAPEWDPQTGRMGIRPRQINPIWADVPLLLGLSLYSRGLIANNMPANP